jgi:hypothetical protein
MKTITMTITIRLWVVTLIFVWSNLYSGVAKAAQQIIYLPVIAQNGLQEATQEEADFQIDHIRLWSAAENGSTLDACGQQHKVQIHVFDRHGDSGRQARLNGVIVQVIQYDNGRQIEEFQATGLPGSEYGVVEFELKQFADVRIFADVDGHRVSSQTARITTMPQAIPAHHLIAAGYCQDDTSCQSIRQANQCAGRFSWNVVFKRRY